MLLKDTNKPDLAIQAIANIGDENAVFVLKDFGFYMRQETYPEFDVVIGWLDEMRQVLSNRPRPSSSSVLTCRSPTA